MGTPKKQRRLRVGSMKRIRFTDIPLVGKPKKRRPQVVNVPKRPVKVKTKLPVEPDPKWTTAGLWPQSVVERMMANVHFPSSPVNKRGELLPTAEDIEEPLPLPIKSGARLGIVGRGPLHLTMARELGASTYSWPIELHHIEEDLPDVLILPAVNWAKIAVARQVIEKYPNILVIFWWTGTDVLQHFRYASRFPKYPRFRQKFYKAVHLCVSRRLQAELRSKDIRAQLLTLPPHERHIVEAVAPPEQYTVVSYMPLNRVGFYGWSKVVEVARLCPDIRFIFFGTNEQIRIALFDLPPNIERRGWVNIHDLLRESNCLLRLTNHDGFPKCVIEAKQHNRVVITNQEMPYVVQMSEPAEIAAFLRGRPQPNPEGCEYYKNFNYDEIKRVFNRG